ncbi:MAG: UDP-N-acetylmuramate--L-alanine ligase [Oligoflexia bacterium]|nr:MAG: UDP-N-acetylmuramate--L-alanine ligase [Oligoflexia bacterium]
MHLRKSKIHFVGVGGIGMCGLAELMHNIGAQVTGSDLAENVNTEHLKKIGIKVFKGHKADQVGDVDVVVYSSAVQMDNPEMKEARARQIPLIPRAEALAEVMRLKRGIAIAGTHGKTTTTSMVAAIFLHAQVQPTIVVGGRLDLIQSTALLGEGEWLIAEADESDGSFQKLSPEIAIITNIDNDHMDYYKSFENLQNAFLSFALKTPFYGMSIVCGDDPQIRALFEHYPKRILYYGFLDSNDFVIKGEPGKYELYEGKKKIGSFDVKVPGRHNALNAVAAIIAGMKAGLSFETCREGLLQFQGVDRRFHYKGEVRNIKVYDDYGHHPTEVKATLQAFREKFPENRLVVYFQPHRYSRTESCWQDFVTCFQQCDELFVTDIYPAGEKPIAGITSEKLVSEIKHKSPHYLPKNPQMSEVLLKKLQPNDIFITLGAGDGWKLGLEVLEKLKS